MLETAGLALTLAAPIKVAIDFESAMADVKKVVDFDEKTNEANEFAEKLKKLSREIVSWKCDIKRSKKEDNSIKMWLSPGLSDRKTVVL
uniref:phage tail tape measure protein n=1 Tax=Wolbachia endosymbiont (group A) of Anomoia purmunda TaxID=2953978 RepID=UPI0022320A65|nr:phage tail tape measure protein [Wolbachia endosymbiont (group A) of Anomoia purmunda]